MSLFLQLCLALLLDCIFGEPRWIWSRFTHPAVWMGRLVSWCDKIFNHGPVRILTGGLALFVLIMVALGAGWGITQLGPIITTFVAAILLAQKSLVDHVQAVAEGLRLSTGEAQRAVSMIVSRDVSQASPSNIARAGLESLAENFSDGVIAPAFWFLIGGLPAMLVYKMVNTADSMIGYHTPRYEAFGKASARLDDILNWVPARLSAILLLLAGGGLRFWPQVMAEARLHRSPNAGWPEAAMAHSLNYALAGPRSYQGKVEKYAWINENGLQDLGAKEIDAGVMLIWKAWGIVLVTAGAVVWSLS